MDAESLIRFASAALVPLLSAALAFLKENWERKQEPEAMRRATARVMFWRALFEAQSTVLPNAELNAARKFVAGQLTVAAELAVRSQEVHVVTQADERPRGIGRRALFLYMPPGPWIWLLRVCFYYYAFYSLVGIPLVAVKWIGGDRFILRDLPAVVVLLCWLVLLWWLVRYSERMTIRVIMRKQRAAELAEVSRREFQYNEI